MLSNASSHWFVSGRRDKQIEEKRKLWAEEAAQQRALDADMEVLRRRQLAAQEVSSCTYKKLCASPKSWIASWHKTGSASSTLQREEITEILVRLRAGNGQGEVRAATGRHGGPRGAAARARGAAQAGRGAAPPGPPLLRTRHENPAHNHIAHTPQPWSPRQAMVGNLVLTAT